MFCLKNAKRFWSCFIPIVLVTFASGAIAKPKGEEEFRPGTVLYKISVNASTRDLKGLNALLKSQGLVSERTLDGSQIVIATFEHHGRETAIANILKTSGYVEFAEPDYVVEPIAQPNDPSFGNQWHHNNVNSQQAWDVTTGNSVLVAVCDTGFDVNHPDLGPNLRTDLAFNANDGSNYIFDANGHGTGSAGTLGAVGNNNTGVAGASWSVDIIPVRIAISDSNSSAYISTMATCIEYAADNNARIVNLSYGGIQYATIDAAAQYLRARNGLLFMSAGNSGQEHPTYPDYTSFVGVGATNRSDGRASFSSWGNYVDITAPGVEILTTYPNNRYVYYSGTSFSSPLTAGIAALMVAANPNITPSEIENGLFSTAVDIGTSGDDNVFGHGLVDAAAAVNYAVNLGGLEAPVAVAGVDNNSLPFGTPFNFDGSASSDPDGTVISYLWDFGDGTTSNEKIVSHEYATAGSFQVSLTVTDNDGLTDSDTTSVQVTNELPVAVITGLASSYDVTESIFFDGRASSDAEGNIINYDWDFGNGDSDSGATTNYSYPSGGDFTVTLTVTDEAGASNSTSSNVTIIDPNVFNAPSNLTALVDGFDVNLTWRDNSNVEVGFVVERGIKFRGRIVYTELPLVGVDVTSFTDTVSDTGSYRYRVSAENAAGDRVTSETITVSVESSSPDPEPEPGSLAAPTDLTGSTSGNMVVLNWTDNSGDEEGFYIERGLKTKGRIDFQPLDSVGSNVTSFSYDSSSLSNGNYGYRVRAYKGSETSGYSNTVELRKK
ncbi:S8 family serine peptidase [Vibrio sonorensis]|uniref:S8 family serine peptidase n=1 Tax=Vibrio sonorensis TaxID=1004316 RepID=UPI0008D9C007|nr:S8 family serine peptidase [Vibrio sonorensis]